MAKLHAELMKLQFWAKHTGARIVVIFEGRDAQRELGAPWLWTCHVRSRAVLPESRMREICMFGLLT
jgi:hypothetical protein